MNVRPSQRIASIGTYAFAAVDKLVSDLEAHIIEVERYTSS